MSLTPLFAYGRTFLVVQTPHAQVDGCPGHSARPIGSHEDRHVCHLLECHEPSRVVPARDQLLPLFPGHARSFCLGVIDFLQRACLRDAVWPQTDHTTAHGCEPGGELSSE